MLLQKGFDLGDDFCQAAVSGHRQGGGRVAVRIDAVERVGAVVEQGLHGLRLLAVDGAVQGLVLVVVGGVLGDELRLCGDDLF